MCKDEPHKHGWCVCRLCEYRCMCVWPVNVITGEENMECGNCGNMTLEPEE